MIYHSNRKYGNRKVSYNGRTFDSVKEKDRYMELIVLERAGVIVNLRCQTGFPLLPPQYTETTDKKGKTKKKLVERGVNYIADFVYYDTKEKKIVVEDVKGYKTEVYKLKKKLMLYIHGIEVKEI